jgi:hypothetical protein
MGQGDGQCGCPRWTKTENKVFIRIAKYFGERSERFSGGSGQWLNVKVEPCSPYPGAYSP